jgi:hypothetical protein
MQGQLCAIKVVVGKAEAKKEFSIRKDLSVTRDSMFVSLRLLILDELYRGWRKVRRSRNAER